MIGLAASAVGQEKGKPEAPAGMQNKIESPGSFSFGGAGTLFQSAGDLRAASESLARFGESMEKTTNNIGGTSEAVAEHLAQMSSGFDPLGLQNAFKTIQQQSEVIREQQDIIYRLQQREIQRLQRENQQLKAAIKAAKSQERPEKKKRNEANNP
jgi:hypothetical protein